MDVCSELLQYDLANVCNADVRDSKYLLQNIFYLNLFYFQLCWNKGGLIDKWYLNILHIQREKEIWKSYV